MKKMARRLFTALLLTVGVMFATATAASAAVTVTPNTNVPDTGNTATTVSVGADGLGATTTTAYVMLCNNTPGITSGILFLECSNFSVQQTTPAAGAFSGFSFSFKPTPDEALGGDVDWRCGADGDANGTIVDGAGLRVFSTCQIRVVPASLTDVDNDQFTSITFAAPEPVIPEAPFSLLLPAAAIAVLGAGFFVLRGRQAFTR